ncbi:2,3-diphosphoglycerate-dependent phosphoglycerate mutase [Bacillus cereus]|nr:2,3-diphosphoglycerate-dependent phosphoglycerate mutase [Bacillus cereus]
MVKLVLIRHGQSEWNVENRFTGWTDVDLSNKGLEEAREAGVMLKANGFSFDTAFTSVLRRAMRTLWITLEEMDLMWIPVHKTWKLNERHYGALQGLNKEETARKYGDEQVTLWRRSTNVRPPALTKDDERYEATHPKYRDLNDYEFPLTEDLEDTEKRVVSYWNEEISPNVKAGKQVIIAAHGNTIRALVKHLDQISDEDIENVNIPTGTPLVYELDNDLKPIDHYYLNREIYIK